MKISQHIYDSKDFSKFWWLPWFPAQNNTCLKLCNTVYDVVSMATCLKKNDGAKMAQRWCRGSKNSKFQKLYYQKIVNSYQNFFFNESICLWFGNDGIGWCRWHPHCQITKSRFIEKVFGMNLLFFINNFLILNKVFGILNF